MNTKNGKYTDTLLVYLKYVEAVNMLLLNIRSSSSRKIQ